MEKQPLIPLCRLYESTSQRGKKYLAGNLTFTTRVVGFEEEIDGQKVWQLYVQERQPKSPPTQPPAQPPSVVGLRRPAAQPEAMHR